MIRRYLDTNFWIHLDGASSICQTKNDQKSTTIRQEGRRFKRTRYQRDPTVQQNKSVDLLNRVDFIWRCVIFH